MTGRRITGRRILALWLPRLGAERLQRRDPALVGAVFAAIAEEKGALRLASVSAAAEAIGLRPGLAQADARALYPALRTAPADAQAEADFLAGLRRWAGRYAPWVGEDGADGLALDVTGCAHLFGGEAALLQEMTGALAGFGLSAEAAVADAKGAAWALARFGPRCAIAPEGGAREALSELPIAALRLDETTLDGLARLGLRQVQELARLPRASLTRRFGALTLRRLDQAFGAELEPVSPKAPPPVYAARLSLPEPIGLASDLRAGLERLAARLCARLEQDQRGARRLRFSLRGADHRVQHLEIGLARPSRDAAQIAMLFEKSIETVEAGFGIDALRLHALAVEPLGPRQTHAGPSLAGPSRPGEQTGDKALDDLLTRLGQRLGLERLTRLAPAESWAPEKAFTAFPAAYSEPSGDWPSRAAACPERPLAGFAPEPIDPLDPPGAAPPERFRWRGAAHRLASARGPERIAPEWWLDDPAWRTGLRDYWRVETESGLRLWLFHTPQAERPPQWFAAGLFA